MMEETGAICNHLLSHLIGLCGIHKVQQIGYQQLIASFTLYFFRKINSKVQPSEVRMYTLKSPNPYLHILKSCVRLGLVGRLNELRKKQILNTRSQGKNKYKKKSAVLDSCSTLYNYILHEIQ